MLKMLKNCNFSFSLANEDMRYRFFGVHVFENYKINNVYEYCIWYEMSSEGLRNSLLDNSFTTYTNKIVKNIMNKNKKMDEETARYYLIGLIQCKQYKELNKYA